MEELTMRQHPAWVRQPTNRHGEYPVNWHTFKCILIDFSRLKMNGELRTADSKDFKDDLWRNNPETVVNFIEKSIDYPDLHPCVFLSLFEVLKTWLLENKISGEKHLLLCQKLLEERGEEISRRYDLEKVKETLLISA